MAELGALRRFKIGLACYRRDIMELLSVERGAIEFMNNPGKRFDKAETSGRHISHEAFKINAASVCNEISHL